jgi:GNAT superfamily N-acetyltransferase
MPVFVPFEPDKHLGEYIKMNIELGLWYAEQLKEKHQFDLVSALGMSIPEYVHENTDFLTNLKPPEGIIYMIEADGEIAGTGAIKKLGKNIGELKRMYVRPKFRGRGYGRQLLDKVLEAGEEFGRTSYILDTPPFADAAHHIYRSVGFKDRPAYPETEVPPALRPIWMFMEKKEQTILKEKDVS